MNRKFKITAFIWNRIYLEQCKCVFCNFWLIQCLTAEKVLFLNLTEPRLLNSSIKLGSYTECWALHCLCFVRHYMWRRRWAAVGVFLDWEPPSNHFALWQSHQRCVSPGCWILHLNQFPMWSHWVASHWQKCTWQQSSSDLWFPPLWRVWKDSSES